MENDAKMAEAVPTVGETPPFGLSGSLGGCNRLRGPVEMASDGTPGPPFVCVLIDTLGRLEAGESRIPSRLRFCVKGVGAVSEELGTSSSSNAVAGWDPGDVK